MKYALNEDYVSLWTILFTIEKSSISTCHRDENGSVFTPKNKHPSYTIIFYLEPMDEHKERNAIYGYPQAIPLQKMIISDLDNLKEWYALV
jgi:hypothetical protein